MTTAAAAPGTATAGNPAPGGDAPATSTIGRKGEDVIALAFEGGGADTVMQLGVIQALVVAECRAPDVVAGISAGAMNAAALAEVFQAAASGETADDTADEEKRRERRAGDRIARLDRLRTFLDAWVEAPPDLVRSILPDPYEISAAAALKPTPLPIQSDEEAGDRRDAAVAHAGLTQLMNVVIGVRVPISEGTRAIRRVLGMVATENERNRPLAYCSRVWDAVCLWLLAWRNVFHLAPLVGELAWGVVVGRPPAQEGADAQRLMKRAKWRWILDWTAAVQGFVVAVLLLLLAPVWVVLRPVVLAFSRRAPKNVKRGGRSFGRWLRRRILRRYSIVRSLASPHPLRMLLVRMFDPTYYGERVLPGIVDRALGARHTRLNRPTTPAAPRTLREYATSATDPVRVVPIAADVGTGRLVSLDPDQPIVDSLLAASAVTPVFPAARALVDGQVRDVIDGVNVANAPTSAVIAYLRRHVDRKARRAVVIPVSPYPLSREEIPADPDDLGPSSEAHPEYTGAVASAFRVLRLRRFRDAQLERRLTRLYTRLLPDTDTAEQPRTVFFPDVDDPKARFIRAVIETIEPDVALSLNQRLLRASDEGARRRMIRQAVADGCRITLESVLRGEVLRASAPASGDTHPAGAEPVVTPSALSVSCTRVIEARTGLKARVGRDGADVGPGIPEVCNECVLARGAVPERRRELHVRGARVSADAVDGFEWPRRDRRPVADPPVHVPPPEKKDKEPQDDRPWVSLLFSGGVFRGVFQVGVVNGLSMAGLRPSLVAGASVGSIMGAFAAQVFRHDDRAERDRQVRVIASAFLGLDRLVLTDRFSNFIRNLTLRAAASKFSLHDLDLVLRRYDDDSSGQYVHRVRRVAAGLERLLYLSPFELRDWIRECRKRDYAAVTRLFLADLQELLSRMGVGQEILGADPMELLIHEVVLGGAQEHRDATFDWFRRPRAGQREIELIAVTTNLTRGKLEVLPTRSDYGSKPEYAPGQFRLVQGLLASSAFPLVFRPRRAGEIRRDLAEPGQYADGGVMDNLPFDAVARHLLEAASEGRLARRPKAAPHLIIAASLEPDVAPLSDDDAQDVAGDWTQLQTRAKQLAYNTKVETYERAQHDFQVIHGQRKGEGFVPLRIEVMTVKPRWLCGTFAFHPMLGFRRDRQAESIAHGCASTLAMLWLRFGGRPRTETEAWGLRIETFDSSTIAYEEDASARAAGAPPDDSSAEERRRLLRLQPRSGVKEPACCFLTKGDCPFASRSVGADVPTQTEKDLNSIYLACRRAETHAPR